MDVMKTHGAFSWSELVTSDPAAASGFYSQLFGWTVKEMGPEMNGYRAPTSAATASAASWRCLRKRRACRRTGAFM